MKYILDASLMTDKETTHEYLQKVMGFPDYYGKNLDALYDCLTELSDAEISFVNVAKAGRYFEKINAVFEDAAEYNINIKINYRNT